MILGAGYDCRAYRLPGMPATRVFELDQPGILAIKIERLRDLLGTLPGHVSFVEVDFDRQDFAALLLKSEFNPALPSFGDMRRIPKTLKNSGETWTFRLYPEQLRKYLSDHGFSLITDIGSLEFRARYMGAKGNHLKGFEFYRAALAETGCEVSMTNGH